MNGPGPRGRWEEGRREEDRDQDQAGDDIGYGINTNLHRFSKISGMCEHEHGQAQADEKAGCEGHQDAIAAEPIADFGANCGGGRELGNGPG